MLLLKLNRRSAEAHTRFGLLLARNNQLEKSHIWNSR